MMSGRMSPHSLQEQRLCGDLLGRRTPSDQWCSPPGCLLYHPVTSASLSMWHRPREFLTQCHEISHCLPCPAMPCHALPCPAYQALSKSHLYSAHEDQSVQCKAVCASTRSTTIQIVSNVQNNAKQMACANLCTCWNSGCFVEPELGLSSTSEEETAMASCQS